jgi:hypothetical protein
MKQWCDDVDRVLGMAHSGSARPRPQSFWRQHEASASVRSPSMKAAPTEDLRVELNRWHAGEDASISPERPDDLQKELNRRRAGEDARVSLESARERRLNFEGRNLDQDFAPHAPQTPRGARTQTGVPLVGVGCTALADHLHAATWPPKFRPHLPEKYDGTSNPSEFLQVYVTAITAAGGNTAVMASYFHVAFLGRALCMVHSELCQCLSAAWCGGSSPCCKTRTRGDSPGFHRSLHQGTRDHTSRLQCLYHHCFPTGGA